MRKEFHCLALFIQAFCAVYVTAQKASLFQAIDSIRFGSNQKYLGTYFTDVGAECTFDQFGPNGKAEFICTCNNLDAAKTIQTQKLWSGGGLGLSLSGSSLNKLGVWDGGAARTTHREFGSRISIMDLPSATSAHTTGIAGCLMATGIDPNAKGMSYQTLLRNWNFSNDNAEIIVAAPSLLVSNHAYATTTAWVYSGGNLYWYGDSSINMYADWKFGYYDSRSRIWDSVMYANPYYLMVKAAGNDRGSGVAPGTTHYYWNGSAWALSNTTRDTVGPYDCISTFGTAKNLLTIGAVNAIPTGFTGSSGISMLPFSSWGPTDDGRIKPDLVGASGNIYTVGSAHDSDYAYIGGTSIASANISGSLLLLQEYHMQLKGRYMRNATLKALAIHTANRCKNNPGPDYECGWGLPDMARAALCLQDSFKNTLIEQSLNQNDSFYTDLYVTAGDTLRITLAWTDPKGITAAPAYNDTTPKLVNDLDLRLTNLAGNVLGRPFVLNPANPSAAAQTGDNRRDNVEQVYVPGMSAGRYRILVKHKGVLQNGIAQPFSLIISGSPLYTPALPVSWLNFRGSQTQARTMSLYWQLAREENNRCFVIEYSTDGLVFSEVGRVFSKNGNSNRLSSYGFNHTGSNGFPQWNYYRIRQIDYDGTAHFSETIAIECTNTWYVQQVYPNPFQNLLEVQLNCANPSENTFSVFSMNGELKFQEKRTLQGSGSQTFDLTSLPQGMYILEIKESGSDNIYHGKIIKVN